MPFGKAASSPQYSDEAVESGGRQDAGNVDTGAGQLSLGWHVEKRRKTRARESSRRNMAGVESSNLSAAHPIAGFASGACALSRAISSKTRHPGMSMIDDLLDDYEAVAEAARRLVASHAHSEGRGRCCENGRCLRCDEAYIQAEEHLGRALAKVAPRPFRLGARDQLNSGSGPPTQQETNNLRSGPTEYLRRFFSELEKLKGRESYYVSHAICFPDKRLCVLVSIGDFRERVYVEHLNEDPLSAAQKVSQTWQAKRHNDEDIE